MINIKELHFDEDGLIPAIIVDAQDKEVLMMAYMNEESLQISMSEGRVCFWSRSREELWRKGESSGNVQHIINIKTDCDKDTLLVTVKKDGPACHTGEESCFFEDIYNVNYVDVIDKVESDNTGGAAGTLPASKRAKHFSLEALHEVIKNRKIDVKPGSYTNYLFEKGIDKILKKIGEESTEVIIAAKAGDKKEVVYELSDLVYHALVLMTEMDISLEEVLRELEGRQK
ncbi:MAG: bifunctional phosphoribosyl-AMP cyclohydrolase/phosphoribosyl-ATP diphosphatase HisIE [Oscillospiraceae bacterium]|nr:bifunctional phosphoribosyl-AMP cyclohydrolase/phosphoribosyl-ATP diphosphatase HisIE [Oscillospiraceae bacterium]